MTAPGGGETFNLSVNIDPSGAQTGAQQVIRQLQQIQLAQQGQVTGSAQMAKGYQQVGASLQSLSRYAMLAKAAIVGFITTSAMRNVAELAARYETLGVVMRTAGKNAGYNAEQLELLERKLRSTGITMAQSRQSIVSMMQAQLDLAQSAKLARAAQDVAVVAGLNSSQTLQRMMHGIVAGQTEVLRTIGLGAVSFEAAYKKMADASHRTVEQLTSQERVQARVNAVMEAAVPLAGTYEAAMGTAGKQLQSMKRYVEDLKTSLGTLLLPVFTKMVMGTSDALQDANRHLERTVQIIRVALVAGVVLATAKIVLMMQKMIALNGVLGLLSKHPVILFLSLLAGGVTYLMTREATAQAKRMDQMEAWKGELDKLIQKYEEVEQAADKAGMKAIQADVINQYNAAQLRVQQLQATTRVPGVASSRYPGTREWSKQQIADRQALADAEEQQRSLKATLAQMGLWATRPPSKEPPATTPTGLSAEDIKAARQRVEDAFKAMARARDEFFAPGPIAGFRREMEVAVEDFTKAAQAAFPKEKAAAEVARYTAQWKEFTALRIADAIDKAGAALDKETQQITGLAAATLKGVDAVAEFGRWQRVGAKATDLMNAGWAKEFAIMKAAAAVRDEDNAARTIAVKKYDDQVAAQDRLYAASQRGAEAYRTEAREQAIDQRATEIMTEQLILFADAKAKATAEYDKAQARQGQQTLDAYKAETDAIRKQVEALGLSAQALRERAREREIDALAGEKGDREAARRAVDERLRVQEQGQLMTQALEERRAIMENFVRAMQETVSDFFNQLFSGTLNSLERFVDAVIAAFTRMVSEIMAKKVMGKLQGFLEGLFNPKTAMAGFGGATVGAGMIQPNEGAGSFMPAGMNWGGIGMAALGGGLIGYGAGATGGAGAGILAGGLSGAMMGMAAGPWGALIGGVVGVVGGLFGASKKAKEAAKQMEEARKNFTIAMDAYVRAAQGTNNAVSDALRQNEQQRLDLLKQADAAYSGRKNEARRNAERARVDATAAQNANRIADDFIRGLADSVAELKVPGGIAQREEALRRELEANIQAANAIANVTKKTEALRLANEKYQLSMEALQQQIEEQRLSFTESTAIRAARVAGDERKALELELEAGRRRELATMDALLKAGIITTEMFAAMAEVLSNEVAQALANFDKAAREATRQFDADLEVRRLRAMGETRKADELAFQQQQQREREEYITKYGEQRPGAYNPNDPLSIMTEEYKRWLELLQVQQLEWNAFQKQYMEEVAATTSTGQLLTPGGQPANVPLTLEGPIIIQVHFHGDVATTDTSELAREIAEKVAPEVDRALGYQYRAQQRRTGSAIA